MSASAASTARARPPLGSLNGKAGSKLPKPASKPAPAAAPADAARKRPTTAASTTATTTNRKRASSASAPPSKRGALAATSSRPSSSSSVGSSGKRRATGTSGGSSSAVSTKSKLLPREEIAKLKEQKAELASTLSALRTTHGALETTHADLETAHADLKTAHAELGEARGALATELASTTADLGATKAALAQTQTELSTATQQAATLNARLEATQGSLLQAQTDIADRDAKIAGLEGQVADLEAALAAARQQSMEDERVRRILHNKLAELKGNIRVFCRVRPLLSDETSEGKKMEHLEFPDADKDSRALVLAGEEKSCTGKVTPKHYNFEFDRVFGPASTQEEVFSEISQLIQSALDGYNVCIFAYGQTGSGKTHTMEGGEGRNAGMIPRAVQQIFASARELQDKGWSYTMTASFLEIYNEQIRDLLVEDAAAAASDDKYEIKNVKGKDEMFVTNLTLVEVGGEEEVHALLARAAQNRSIARTEMNERSSRSHSVFRLKLAGTNAQTGESCEANLNLVDLAGSERLANSGATGQRLKETTSINGSLSVLGNVIMALANGDKHVPYRNSKLTFLLQKSLGGNSKALMFVNLNPCAEYEGESLNSLRFATKVNNCNIGSARAIKK